MGTRIFRKKTGQIWVTGYSRNPRKNLAKTGHGVSKISDNVSRLGGGVWKAGIGGGKGPNFDNLDPCINTRFWPSIRLRNRPIRTCAGACLPECVTKFRSLGHDRPKTSNDAPEIDHQATPKDSQNEPNPSKSETSWRNRSPRLCAVRGPR